MSHGGGVCVAERAHWTIPAKCERGRNLGARDTPPVASTITGPGCASARKRPVTQDVFQLREEETNVQCERLIDLAHRV